jgi:PAS domain-containing protein
MSATDPVPNSTDRPTGVEQLRGTTDLANVLESDRFKRFLDHIPIAIAVAELKPDEHIVYTNIEFERLTGRRASDVFGNDWSIFPPSAVATDDSNRLSDAIASGEDYIGTFALDWGDQPVVVDAWSNVIQDDDREPVFRLLALAEPGQRSNIGETDLQAVIREKGKGRPERHLARTRAALRGTTLSKKIAGRQDRPNQSSGRLRLLLKGECPTTPPIARERSNRF